MLSFENVRIVNDGSSIMTYGFATVTIKKQNLDLNFDLFEISKLNDVNDM